MNWRTYIILKYLRIRRDTIKVLKEFSVDKVLPPIPKYILKLVRSSIEKDI
jgi:hypothetical protein